MKKIIIASSIVLSANLLQSFDFGSLFESATKIMNTQTKQSSKTIEKESSLSSSVISDGLKEALKNGVDYGVKELSKDGGYLNNISVKIPLPENLSKVESLIRSVGGEKIADNLISSMNSAATTAAPKTAKIFINSIDKMSIEDAKNILAGDKDAATQYFKSHTTKDLVKMVKPIIQKTMQENNVASYYNTFNEYYNSYGKSLVKNSGIADIAKKYGADQFIPQETDENLDDYVTQKAIDGLFIMIASKEGEIRENPIAQTTSLLKQVFGN